MGAICSVGAYWVIWFGGSPECYTQAAYDKCAGEPSLSGHSGHYRVVHVVDVSIVGAGWSLSFLCAFLKLGVPLAHSFSHCCLIGTSLTVFTVAMRPVFERMIACSSTGFVPEEAILFVASKVLPELPYIGLGSIRLLHPDS
jgi:hypothetical protein